MPEDRDIDRPRGFRRGVRLAVDVGAVRIGVAASDPGGLLASPVETVPAGPGAAGRVAALVTERSAIEVVVGLPRSLSGREGAAARAARDFAGRLRGVLPPQIGLRLVDERMSTVSAISGMRAAGVRERQGRARVDQAAAVIILEAALASERGTGIPPGESVRVDS